MLLREVALLRMPDNVVEDPIARLLVCLSAPKRIHKTMKCVCVCFYDDANNLYMKVVLPKSSLHVLSGISKYIRRTSCLLDKRDAVGDRDARVNGTARVVHGQHNKQTPWKSKILSQKTATYE